MNNQYRIIQRLTLEPLSDVDMTRMLNDFAEGRGSGVQAIDSEPRKLTNLRQSIWWLSMDWRTLAVLTFLKGPREYTDLNYEEKNRLLALSYNNLVDWHVQIGSKEGSVVYNRVQSTDASSIVDNYRLLEGSVDRLRSELFEQVIGKRPNPNLPALDDALIDTISDWKRKLSAEFSNTISNEPLSALFNAIIFARAVEDHSRRLSLVNDSNNLQRRGRALLVAWDAEDPLAPTIRDLLHKTISGFIGEQNIPAFLMDNDLLKTFDDLDKYTVQELLSDFYKNKIVPYEYDFSVMSKHALSRIYEHYVSMLRSVELPKVAQLSFFPSLPEEEKSKAFGGIYTPQYIARFFGKLLSRQMTPWAFTRILVADPACGLVFFYAHY